MHHFWFDAHLDLAYLAARGRDMDAWPDDVTGPDLPAAVTLPSLSNTGPRAAGACHVGLGLATIFVEPDGSDPRVAYRRGDAHTAHLAGLVQLEIYRSWFASGRAGTWGNTPANAGNAGTPANTGTTRDDRAPIRLALLIENADCIREPAELAWWARQGVVAVGMAWFHQGRYASGNGCNGPADTGLTADGRSLAAEVTRLNLVHDLSHLSDRACAELLDSLPPQARVMASHSNCRSLMRDPANQRHLTDATIRAIAQRRGVIGLNLYSKFLKPGLLTPADGRASLIDTLAHVEHICQITGSRAHVGLGSDMDGGFSAARLPEGIDLPGDLHRLADTLAAGPFRWPDEDIAAFASANFCRLFRLG